MDNTFDLNEEIRNGYTVSADMKKVWAVQLELLAKLLDVCRKHDLKIYAVGGTLIGAVREHGYIPWDDDIDMGMMRNDYDRLIDVAGTEFGAPYHFQTGYTENNYPRGHAQLRKDGTTAILKSDILKAGFHQGIFIDIFVFDAIPDDESTRKRLKEQSATIFDKLTLYSYGYSLWKFFSHPGRCIYARKAIREVRKTGFRQMFKTYDDLFRTNRIEDNKLVGDIAFVFEAAEKRRMSKEWFGYPEYMPFENIMIPVPHDYHAVLTAQYGDYMKPAKTPTIHGGFAALDTGRSYREYLPELRRRERRDKQIRKWKHVLDKIRNMTRRIMRP